MIIIRLLKFGAGYVKFSAVGVNPERFLNMCAKQGIELWDISFNGEYLFANVKVKNYRKLRALAKKSGLRLKVRKKVGLPFINYKYRKRIGIIVGIVLFIAIISTLKSFVWVIDVEGNKELSKETIIAAYEELGFKTGARISKLNLSELESDALTLMPELSWSSINITGSSAVIEVREKNKAPESVEVDKPCNIIASRGGQICRMTVYEGVKYYDIGDSVAEGDLIVSGVIENQDLSSSFVHSMAEIIAKTKRSMTVKIPMRQEKIIYTGKIIERNSIGFFGANIPLFIGESPDENYELYEEDIKAVVNGVKLPINRKKEIWREYTIESELIDESEAKKLADAELLELEKREMKDIKIVERKTKHSFENELCILTVEYDCEEDIAKTEEILIDENNQ